MRSARLIRHFFILMSHIYFVPTQKSQNKLPRSIQLELGLYKQTVKLVTALVRQMEEQGPVARQSPLSVCLLSPFATLLSAVCERLHTVSCPTIPHQSYAFLMKKQFNGMVDADLVELWWQRHTSSFPWLKIH